jgi:tetratricopeptide (TPR) repeat protein
LTRLDDLLKKYHAVATWILILVAFVVYRGALTCGFVFDDVEQILQNPFVKNPHLWRRVFLGPVWSFIGGGGQMSFYRPLHIFSYWLVCRVAGFDTSAYHLLQLVLYTLGIWTVYRLGRKILQNELAAFAGALLWTLHPLHVEAVVWVSATPDLGCALFCLLGFWFFLRAEDRSPANFRWHVVAAAVYFPALFFKEMAFSFPLLLLVYWFCFSSAEPWFRRALNWLPYVAAVGVCSIIRIIVMGSFSDTSPSHEFHSKVVWSAIGLLGRHAKLFFWPAHLSEFREFDLSASLHSPWPWTGLLILAAACVWRKRDPRLSFLVLWWGTALLPCLNYLHLSFPLVADRFSYLPSVGLCLALGYLAFAWPPVHFPNVRLAWAAAEALTAVAGLWAAQTVRTIPHWHDNDTLFDYSLRVSPNAALVHVSRGVVLQFRERDYNGAAREFQTALRLNAESLKPLPVVTYNSYIGLGQVALIQGREPEALDYFNKAVRLLHNFNVAYDMLGSVYFPRGDYARASGYFQQAVRANPQDVVARFFLGTCWMKLGKPAQAAEQFHLAREVDPDYFQAYAPEAPALEAAGDKAGAARVRSEMASRSETSDQ